MASLLSVAGLVPSPSPSLPGDAPPEGFVPFDQQLYGDSLAVVIVKAVVLLVFLLVSVILAVWFERKVISRMQERVGPNIHGPFGLFQLIGDTIKLVVKEDVSVRKADKVLYIAAPMVSVISAMLVFSVIPIGPAVRIPFTDDVTPIQLTDFPVAGLFVLACAAIGVYGIVLGGWASGSTYPLLGAVRSTAQVVSYELAMGLSLVTVFIMSASMYTQDIVNAQENLWFGVTLLPAFLLYVVAMVGEANRLPFDLPEAEGELVAGYMTEYSSVKFAWYFLAEYINMLNVSAIATTFFLGGWRAPWPLSAVSDGVLNTGYWPVLWFLAKLWLLMFVFVWIRGSLMRLRYDQFMRLGWKVLIPVGLGWVVLFGTARLLTVNDWLPDWMPDLRTGARIAAVIMVIGIIVVLLWPRKPEEDKGGRKPRLTEIDAHAGGFPVPPRPGEKLPPSPRSGRTVDAKPHKRGSGQRD
jgi:NADH-quinone oxidoreductase subunit H